MVVEYLGEGNILFLDISSSCTGWSIAAFNKDKAETDIIKVGVFWFEDDVTHGYKYNKLCSFIKELVRDYKINAVVAEAYFLNAYQLAGAAICPEIQGAVQASLYELDPVPSWQTIAPQSWRAGLKIKKDTTKTGSAAWKEVTKQRVEQILGTMPLKIKSNINSKLRKTPYDLFDSLGICMGYLSLDPNNCKTFRFKGDFDV